MSNYYTSQMNRLKPDPEKSGSGFEVTVKFHSEFGNTNWMNLLPDQVFAIKKILEDVNEHKED